MNAARIAFVVFLMSQGRRSLLGLPALPDDVDVLACIKHTVKGTTHTPFCHA